MWHEPLEPRIPIASALGVCQVNEGYDRAESVILSRPVNGAEASKTPELKKNEFAELVGPRDSDKEYLPAH